MNIKKILIAGVIVSTIAACSGTKAPIVAPAMKEVISVNVTSYYNSVWFYHDSVRMNDDFSTILKLNADYLKANPISLVQLQGNASEAGAKEYNYKLGLDRAHTVAKELIKLGVNPKQIQEISFGSSYPPVTKDKHSPESRRVDIVYTSGAPTSYFIEQLPIVSTEDETIQFESVSVKGQKQAAHVNSSSPVSVPPPTNKWEDLNSSSTTLAIIESTEVESQSANSSATTN